jgi:hypothetical protein
MALQSVTQRLRLWLRLRLWQRLAAAGSGWQHLGSTLACMRPARRPHLLFSTSAAFVPVPKLSPLAPSARLPSRRTTAPEDERSSAVLPARRARAPPSSRGVAASSSRERCRGCGAAVAPGPGGAASTRAGGPAAGGPPPADGLGKACGSAASSDAARVSCRWLSAAKAEKGTGAGPAATGPTTAAPRVCTPAISPAAVPWSRPRATTPPPPPLPQLPSGPAAAPPRARGEPSRPPSPPTRGEAVRWVRGFLSEERVEALS